MPEAISTSGHKPREIRVFISSTFRDMEEDRNELVKPVLAKLRKFCEQRGVVWRGVDLRWGITDEQSAEGEVLPICLEEIERCRPYCIGLLARIHVISATGATYRPKFMGRRSQPCSSLPETIFWDSHRVPMDSGIIGA